MSNGQEQCCAAGICCPPLSAQRVSAITKILVDKGGCEHAHAAQAAACIASEFDLAPHGTLQPFIDAVAMMARAHK